MAKADLYNLYFRSADTTTSTDKFLDTQRKITGGVKRNIKKQLAERGLSAEFAFAAGRVAGHARVAQIYATPAALAVVKNVKDVEKVEKMTVSAYSLTRSL
ncbi:MAG: hypothetical protein ACAH83_08320 [Alphaproteobacteria bacterium]